MSTILCNRPELVWLETRHRGKQTGSLHKTAVPEKNPSEHVIGLFFLTEIRSMLIYGNDNTASTSNQITEVT